MRLNSGYCAVSCRGTYINDSLIQRMLSLMLYNRCKIITMGIDEKVRIFLKNAWLEKILGKLETLRNSFLSPADKQENVTYDPAGPPGEFSAEWQDLPVLEQWLPVAVLVLVQSIFLEATCPRGWIRMAAGAALWPCSPAL